MYLIVVMKWNALIVVMKGNREESGRQQMSYPPISLWEVVPTPTWRSVGSGRVCHDLSVGWRICQSNSANKGRLPTCPWSFWMKLGTKIVSDMLITKIIILAANLTSGVSYRPANFQKIRAAGPGFDRGFWKGVNFNFKNMDFMISQCAESESVFRFAKFFHLGGLGLKKPLFKKPGLGLQGVKIFWKKFQIRNLGLMPNRKV